MPGRVIFWNVSFGLECDVLVIGNDHNRHGALFLYVFMSPAVLLLGHTVAQNADHGHIPIRGPTNLRYYRIASCSWLFLLTKHELKLWKLPVGGAK